MSVRQIKGFLLLTSALGAVTLVAGSSGAVPEDARVSELLDPAVIAAGVCGGSSAHASTFKPMQLALASPAEAILDDPADPPLWEGLGTLSYPITTDNEMAQRYFDQGLRLSYAFNHAEAYRAFKKAQALDPGCAMCFWGEAFVLGANINAPMEGSAVQPAFVAMTNAKARAAKASGPERAL
ncbi:MAG: hypothetical protein ACREGK_03750, partial [Geminicoccales bacterium]